ncbi:hypothetical protein [Actinacidiphila guanduensis]|uniref:hypothetical protein n=1 Tax=Actinacidiphila guanduensis TaxID=310781 RepID=UPI001C40B2D3|nr:hypothetical protein [Actinacidiphila guanduensis]
MADDVDDTGRPEDEGAQERDNWESDGSFDRDGDPDVLLDVPNLSVEEIDLEVEDLRGRVSLHAEVLELLKLDVGVDVALGRVHLGIKGVEAQALLKVRLDNVAAIIERVLATIDRNPQILEQIASGAGRALGEVGRGAGDAAGEVGRGAGDAAGEVGRGASRAVGEVGRGAGDAAGEVGRGAGDAVGEVGQGAGEAAGEVGKGAKEAAGGAGKAVEGVGDSAGKAVEDVSDDVGEVEGAIEGQAGYTAESVERKSDGGSGGGSRSGGKRRKRVRESEGERPRRSARRRA